MDWIGVAFKIGNRDVGAEHPPFVVAEISGNHGGNLSNALSLVDAAAEAGVDAIKLQTYTAETMTLDSESSDFVVSERGSLWEGERLYDLYGRAQTPWEWHEPIFNRARERGLLPFSSPFDASAVAFLDDLDTACLKIASFEITDLPLIACAASTGRPLILSTGLASLAEIDRAVKVVRESGCQDFALLKCSSAYPAPPEYSNLRTLPVLRQAFECEIGVSDHTVGIGAAVASIALGASIVEKHITMSRANGAVDSSFSSEPMEFARLVGAVREAHEALGTVAFGPTPADRSNLRYRRGLFFVRDMRAGDVIDDSCVKSLRPAIGLEPRHLSAVVGRTCATNVQRGTPVRWSQLAPAIDQAALSD